MNNKAIKNTQKSYKILLKNIQNCINKAEKNIANLVIRKKLEMCWQIGKFIEEDLLTNNFAEYGNKIFSKLEQDLAINKATLYKMHNFYQAYPQLPKDNNKLNWSHYRTLADIKNPRQREYLSNLAIENSWNTRQLEKEAKNIKTNLNKIEDLAEDSTNDVEIKTKLKPPIIDKLFCYLLTQFKNSPQIYIDCGFHIFRAAKTTIEAGNMVEAIKKEDDKYLLTKSTSSPKKLYCYKATLERVVDGDTIRVILDLGFKIYHRQILRLREVYAPELETDEGKKAAKKLNDILKDIPFLIIKTNRIDIYGRYVADVFLGKDGLKIGKNDEFGGQYLNGMLQ